jgi:hypothetical protein
MVPAGEGNVPGGKELSGIVMTDTNGWRFLAVAMVAFAAVNLSAQTRQIVLRRRVRERKTLCGNG